MSKKGIPLDGSGSNSMYNRPRCRHLKILSKKYVLRCIL